MGRPVSRPPAVMCIYKITNIVNFRYYIGSTVDWYSRKLDHFSSLRRNKHKNIFMQRDYNKYGVENYIFDVIEIVNQEVALLRIEQGYLNNCVIDSLCMNISEDASSPMRGGLKHSLESRQKMSLSRKGKTLTKEHREAIAAGNRGKTISPEQLAKTLATKSTRTYVMSQEQRDSVSARFKGRKLTKEHKEAISKGNTGRKNSKEAIEKTAAFHRGRKKSPEEIAQRTATRRAKGNYACSQETKDKIVATTKRNKELREKENQDS